MAITVNLHDIDAALAEYYGGFSWLALTDSTGNRVDVFTTPEIADAMAAAFNANKQEASK